MKGKILIYVTIFISIVTYLFWDIIKEKTGISIFWIGNALSVFLMAIVIFINNIKFFGSFFLLCITFNNLIDELFCDPTKFGLNEIIFALILPIIWLIKYKRLCLKRLFNRNSRNYS